MRKWRTLKELQLFDDFKVIRVVETYRILFSGFIVREQEVYLLVYADGLIWEKCGSVYFRKGDKENGK